MQYRSMEWIDSPKQEIKELTLTERTIRIVAQTLENIDRRHRHLVNRRLHNRKPTVTLEQALIDIDLKYKK